MIEISAISARKLPIPHGCEFHFMCTASIGDSSVSSAPVRPVLDHRLGSSVTFREPLSLPCFVDGNVIDVRTFGITLHFRSVCGTLSLGTSVCRVSRQWTPVVPVGECMISFGMSEALSPLTMTHASSEKKGRPATAGPVVRSANLPARDEQSTSSEYMGHLTIGLRAISGLAISTTTPVSLYVQAQFALDEGQSLPIEVTAENDGHRGAWPPGSSITFDVLPSNASRLMTLSVFGAWVRSGQERPSASGVGCGTGPHHLVGVCKVDIPTNLGGENQQLSTTVVLSGHPRSRLDLDITLKYLKPRKEGASGRPLSAYPRRALGTSSSAEFASQSKSVTCASIAQADEEFDVESTSHTTSSKLRAKLTAGRRAWDDEVEGDASAFAAVLLSKLEHSIDSAIGAATKQLMERLSTLENRLLRTEEALAQLRPPASTRPGSGFSGGPRIPKAPSSMSGVASRPSSADSVGGYDVSHSIVTDTQLRAKFHEYDTRHQGWITVPQLIQFYRSNSTFGDDEDETRILRYFDYCGIRVRSSEGVSFDDFARLALRLAQR